MKVPTFVDKTENGIIVAIAWACGCAWDAIIGQVICPKHQEDPEA